MSQSLCNYVEVRRSVPVGRGIVRIAVNEEEFARALAKQNADRCRSRSYYVVKHNDMTLYHSEDDDKYFVSIRDLVQCSADAATGTLRQYFMHESVPSHRMPCCAVYDDEYALHRTCVNVKSTDPTQRAQLVFEKAMYPGTNPECIYTIYGTISTKEPIEASAFDASACIQALMRAF